MSVTFELLRSSPRFRRVGWLTAPLLLVLAAVVACNGNSSNPETGDPGTGGATNGGAGSEGGSNGDPAGFLRVQGRRIVDDEGEPFVLRGISFGNEVWESTIVPNDDHGEVDFDRVKAMGFNTVRFYLNYGVFEHDAEPYMYLEHGFEWLDQNVAWAKARGVRLVLNMHVPQGGFQSLGNGEALWTIEENQNRLVALWKAIAERYEGEHTIVGYGLVNEPNLTLPKSAWADLAGRIATGIREVDQNHILFVERPIRAGGTWMVDADQNFVRLADDNTVYEFHSYDPFEYTHQLFSWAGDGGMGDGGKYPDPSRVSGTNLVWEDWAWDVKHPAVPVGDSDWTLYETGLATPSDASFAAITPVFGSDVNAGTVFVDDVVLKEYDEDGVFLRDAVTLDFEGSHAFTFWSEDGAGSMNPLAPGRNGGKALSLTGTTSYANANDWTLLVPIVPGHKYGISGYIRGEGVAAGADVELRMDYLSGTVAARDKELLRARLLPIVAWSEAEGVPLYAGEFGAGVHCFENAKGGTAWVGDMVDLYEEYGIAWNYHTYHEDAFGVYFGTGVPIDTAKANQPLIDFFTERFGSN